MRLLALVVVAAAHRRVNLVHVLLDDLSPDLTSVHREAEEARGAVYGGDWATPRLAGMAREGVAFRTAYAPSSCAPSRVSLLTGRYPSETGVFHKNLVVPGRACAAAAPWPALLRAAGYATAVAGRWGVRHTVAALDSPEAAGFDAVLVWRDVLRGPALARSSCRATEGGGDAGGDPYPSRYWRACYGNATDAAEVEFGPAAEFDFVADFATRARRPYAIYWPTVLVHETAGRTLPAAPGEGAANATLAERLGLARPENAFGAAEYAAASTSTSR